MYPEARYVRISQNITMEQLAMFEVLVFSNGTNVALESPAISPLHSLKVQLLDSPLMPLMAIIRLIHILIVMIYWWIVDLGCMMPIELVTIMNRWCDDQVIQPDVFV